MSADVQATEAPQVVYLDTAQVRRRYAGISYQTLWKWTRDPALGFPAPLNIGGRNYWRETDLDSFDNHPDRFKPITPVSEKIAGGQTNV
jgi:predicted DNA-binding transcriptional regulator AlpA